MPPTAYGWETPKEVPEGVNFIRVESKKRKGEGTSVSEEAVKGGEGEKKEEKEKSNSGDMRDLPTYEITDANYTLLAKGTWLVQLYAPWCPFSQKLQLIWADLSKTINPVSVHYANPPPTPTPTKAQRKQQGHPTSTIRLPPLLITPTPKPVVYLARIDATKNTKAAALLEIKGFPSIKLIVNSTIYTFSTPTLTLSTLLDFAHGGYRALPYYNRLPTPLTHSIWYQLQLEMYLWVARWFVKDEEGGSDMDAMGRKSEFDIEGLRRGRKIDELSDEEVEEMMRRKSELL
ncbi:hypothetical protein HK102_002853 [Quaeritorhiza haematococci]|nr:hypothetical protein HK102_002853 [Quaeritorhiza haematococci]